MQGLQATVQYFLEAELTRGHQVKSLTRQEMQFCRKVERDKFGEASFIQNEQVGGYFGYRQTPSRNEISISHSVVTPGDQLHIKILSDNSQCNHRTECFKFKLFRRVTYNLPDETQLINCDYLSYHKVAGCMRREKKLQTFTTIVPRSSYSEILGPSVSTESFQVEYFLKVYLKYASIFEIGPGHCVSFPLKLVLPEPLPKSPKQRCEDILFDYKEVLPQESSTKDTCYFQHLGEGDEIRPPVLLSYARETRDRLMTSQEPWL